MASTRLPGSQQFDFHHVDHLVVAAGVRRLEITFVNLQPAKKFFLAKKLLQNIYTSFMREDARKEGRKRSKIIIFENTNRRKASI